MCTLTYKRTHNTHIYIIILQVSEPPPIEKKKSSEKPKEKVEKSKEKKEKPKSENASGGKGMYELRYPQLVGSLCQFVLYYCWDKGLKVQIL